MAVLGHARLAGRVDELRPEQKRQANAMGVQRAAHAREGCQGCPSSLVVDGFSPDVVQKAGVAVDAALLDGSCASLASKAGLPDARTMLQARTLDLHGVDLSASDCQALACVLQKSAPELPTLDVSGKAADLRVVGEALLSRSATAARRGRARRWSSTPRGSKRNASAKLSATSAQSQCLQFMEVQ